MTKNETGKQTQEPDLLEAAKLAADYLEQIHADKTENYGPNSVYVLLRAAIRKAEGQDGR